MLKLLNNEIHKLLLLVGFSLLLSACGSESVSYVTKDSLKYDPMYEQNHSEIRNSKHYGAFKFQEKYDSDDEGKLFVIHKNRGAYEAETFWKESDKKRYYLSMGLNYRERMPMMGFRVEY